MTAAAYSSKAPLELETRTYAWDLDDALVVVVASTPEGARSMVRATFKTRGLDVPHGFDEAEPTVMAYAVPLWCFS